MAYSKRILISVAMLTLWVAASAHAAARPGRNKLTLREQEQEIYFYPAAGGSSHGNVLFAPGDGGWRGFALTIAETLAASGYDVYGLDTHRYLQSFTGPTVLKPTDIAADFRQLARWIRQDSSGRLVLVGWSEGAGLSLAAAGDPQNNEIFEGLITIGATEQNILAWHWSDVMAQLRKKLPDEPTFASNDYVGRVTPLPLFMIASSGDEYVSPQATHKLFSAAHDPKRMVVIDARDHRYAGATEEFFRTLREALQWVVQQRR